jgi:hypothetical protein
MRQDHQSLSDIIKFIVTAPPPKPLP